MPDLIPPARRPLPPLLPVVIVTAVACLLIAPFTEMHYDVSRCWLPWARQTAGRFPWRAYDPQPDAQACNYPPLVLYWMTLAEGARRAMGAAAEGPVIFTLVKLPGLAAWAGGIALCASGLRRPFGDRAAAVAALAWTVGLPVLFNAAAWGQWDAIVSVAILAALVAAMHGRLVWVGLAAGIGLATKVQVVAAAPAIGIYLLRRFGWRGVAVATGSALAVLVAAWLPMIVAGRGGPLREAYVGSVGFTHSLSSSAFNVWRLSLGYEKYVRHLPEETTNDDRRILFGVARAKTVGLALLGAYAALAATAVWRRPTPRGLAVATVMICFAFFMLPTQIKERYVVPAAAVAAVLVPAGWGWFFAALSLTALANEFVVYYYWNHYTVYAAVPDEIRSHPLIFWSFAAVSVLGSVANLALFAWGTWQLVRVGFGPGGAAGPDGSGGSFVSQHHLGVDPAADDVPEAQRVAE